MSWGFRKWQRSSFWLQYGRLRQHLQACDVLLEQINACAALPGRPKLDIPAGISREVQIKHMPCEIPSYVTPESPFDAALNLSFDTPRTPDPNYDCCPDRLNLSDFQIRPLSLEECSSLACKNSQPQSSVISLPKLESQVFSSVSQSFHVQLPDSGEGTCGCPDDPEFCISAEEWKPLHPSSSGSIVVAPLACISENEDQVSQCSGSAPDENPPQLIRPINFISASYYVERPSNPQQPISPSNTRRTSFCRIEAFVIRNKSVKSVPPQSRVGMPRSKK